MQAFPLASQFRYLRSFGSPAGRAGAGFGAAAGFGAGAV